MDRWDVAAVLNQSDYAKAKLGRIVQDDRRYKLHVDFWDREYWVGHADRWVNWGRALIVGPGTAERIDQGSLRPTIT